MIANPRGSFTPISKANGLTRCVLAQVPLCKIISMNYDEIDDIRRQFFPTIPSSYFYQAHTDYTVCDLNGQPLLTIEFDGMYGGISFDSKYTSDYHWDLERELKFNYKLKLANLNNYPLIVISYQEKAPIAAGETISIVDSIIGSCIASLQLRSQVEQNFREMVVSTNGVYTDEDCQNLLWETETMLELEWDPMARLAAEYSLKCFEKGIHNFGFQWITLPQHTKHLENVLEVLPSLPSDEQKTLLGYYKQPTVDALKNEFDALKNKTGIGCKAWVTLANNKLVVETILLRNFNAVHIEPLGIAENIAKYLVFKKALQLNDTEGIPTK